MGRLHRRRAGPRGSGAAGGGPRGGDAGTRCTRGQRATRRCSCVCSLRLRFDAGLTALGAVSSDPSNRDEVQQGFGAGGESLAADLADLVATASVGGVGARRRRAMELRLLRVGARASMGSGRRTGNRRDGWARRRAAGRRRRRAPAEAWAWRSSMGPCVSLREG